jgi:hypothetical protein
MRICGRWSSQYGTAIPYFPSLPQRTVIAQWESVDIGCHRTAIPVLLQIRMTVQRIQQQHHKQLPYLTAVGPNTCISAPRPKARDPDQSDGREDPAAASQTAFWSLHLAVLAGLPDLKNKDKKRFFVFLC